MKQGGRGIRNLTHEAFNLLSSFTPNPANRQQQAENNQVIHSFSLQYVISSHIKSQRPTPISYSHQEPLVPNQFNQIHDTSPIPQPFNPPHPQREASVRPWQNQSNPTKQAIRPSNANANETHCEKKPVYRLPSPISFSFSRY